MTWAEQLRSGFIETRVRRELPEFRQHPLNFVEMHEAMARGRHTVLFLTLLIPHRFREALHARPRRKPGYPTRDIGFVDAISLAKPLLQSWLF